MELIPHIFKQGNGWYFSFSGLGTQSPYKTAEKAIAEAEKKRKQLIKLL